MAMNRTQNRGLIRVLFVIYLHDHGGVLHLSVAGHWWEEPSTMDLAMRGFKM